MIILGDNTHIRDLKSVLFGCYNDDYIQIVRLSKLNHIKIFVKKSQIGLFFGLQGNILLNLFDLSVFFLSKMKLYLDIHSTCGFSSRKKSCLVTHKKKIVTKTCFFAGKH